MTDSKAPGLSRLYKADPLTGREPGLAESSRQFLAGLPILDLLLRMTVRQGRLYTCDCAERVLYTLPTADRRANEGLIDLARRYAWGRVTTLELEKYKTDYHMSYSLRDSWNLPPTTADLFLVDAIEATRRAVRYAAVTWSQDPILEEKFRETALIKHRFRYGVSSASVAARKYEIHRRFDPARHSHLINNRVWDRFTGSKLTTADVRELIAPGDQAQTDEVLWQKNRAVEYLTKGIGKDD